MKNTNKSQCACNPCSGLPCKCGCQVAIVSKACNCGALCRCGASCGKLNA